MARDLQENISSPKSSGLDETSSGKGLGQGSKEEDLANSLLQKDKSKLHSGSLLNEAINQGLFAFSPNLICSQIVKNFNLAVNIYGEKLLKLITGYNPGYIHKNVNVPEFQRELKIKIEKTFKNLEYEELIDSEGVISDTGMTLASFVLLMEELDVLFSNSIGEKKGTIKSHYGDKADSRLFRLGDRYKDLAIKQSVKLALRRGHASLKKEDIKTFERVNKSNVQLIYAIDASGSMKGAKIESAKKAGIALAFKAVQNKDLAGLVVFGSEIKFAERPTRDFKKLLKSITQIRASKQTNFVRMLNKAIELFSHKISTKHLIILTDALPTAGENPELETMEAVSKAKAHNISISIVGINLDGKGKNFAEKIVQFSQGKLYLIKNLQELDKIILEDYYAVA